MPFMIKLAGILLVGTLFIVNKLIRKSTDRIIDNFCRDQYRRDRDKKENE